MGTTNFLKVYLSMALVHFFSDARLPLHNKIRSTRKVLRSLVALESKLSSLIGHLIMLKWYLCVFISVLSCYVEILLVIVKLVNGSMFRCSYQLSTVSQFVWVL